MVKRHPARHRPESVSRVESGPLPRGRAFSHVSDIVEPDIHRAEGLTHVPTCISVCVMHQFGMK